MQHKQLTELAESLHRRAERVLVNVEAMGAGERAERLGWPAELCRKLISDELTSEWLRMHAGRRLKRGETRLLVTMFEQLDTAVSDAIATLEPAAMPTAASEAIRALAAPARSLR